MRKQFLALFMVSMIVLLSASATSLTGDTRQDAEAGPEFTFDRYNSYAEVRAELERISSEYPDIARFSVLGQTWEGRDIMALRLTDNPGENEPAILIMGGHHGNELASVEVPMYILNFLTENYGYNATVREMVDSRDIWFVPLVNPDGREYALNHDPWWRKNRRPVTDDGNTYGVDLNRNYGHRWGELPGASHDPSSFQYCGPHAFSEAETMAIGDLAYARNFSISLSYHTYGEVIYYPWNNGLDTVSPRVEALEAVAGKLGAITGYAPMQGVDAYPTTGDSDDWLYASTNCLPFTVELGTQFITPPEQLEALYARNLGAALYAIDIAAEPEKALLPEWTFMVYMSADVDPGLAAEAPKDINEMEVAGSGPDLNIVVLYDGPIVGDGKIYLVERDPAGYNQVIVSRTVDDHGAVIDPSTREPDMSDPTVLRNFVNWTMANYPARKTALVFWGHGDGVLRSFVPDYTSGGGLRLTDINPALEGFGLDIVGFDTCSLGHFEVAAELAGTARIMIGSQAEEPLAGWDYASPLEKLVQRPWMCPEELAAAIVSDYLASRTEWYITQAAVRVPAVRDALMPALGEFVNVSGDFAHSDYEKIWAARNVTSTFIDRQDAVDLFEFLGNLEGQNVSGPVMDRIGRVLDLRDGLVIHSGTGTRHPDATTMAVYFPRLEDPISRNYAGFMFLETGWDDYLSLIKQPLPRPVISHVPGIQADNTRGPYNITAGISGEGQGPFHLFYRPAHGDWQYSVMNRTGHVLLGEIPGQANGTAVEYYILDASNLITVPYEAKWGGQDYFTFTVFAMCELSLAWAQEPPGAVRAGDRVTFLVNCSNAGPEPAWVNVSLALEGGSATQSPGTVTLFLEAGQYMIAEFNWTAEPGSWVARAGVINSSAFDSSPDAPEITAALDVAGRVGRGFLAEHGMALSLLAMLWCFSILLVARMLGRVKRRRREAAARSVVSARNFLATAREFGADTVPAEALLTSAEAALARGYLQECEGLVRSARESAMNAVGERQA